MTRNYYHLQVTDSGIREYLYFNKRIYSIPWEHPHVGTTPLPEHLVAALYRRDVEQINLFLKGDSQKS